MKYLGLADQESLSRVTALLAAAGTAILAWCGVQFGSLPSKVTVLETKQGYIEKRLDRFDDKLDQILERVK